MSSIYLSPERVDGRKVVTVQTADDAQYTLYLIKVKGEGWAVSRTITGAAYETIATKMTYAEADELACSLLRHVERRVLGFLYFDLAAVAADCGKMVARWEARVKGVLQ